MRELERHSVSRPRYDVSGTVQAINGRLAYHTNDIVFEGGVSWGAVPTRLTNNLLGNGRGVGEREDNDHILHRRNRDQQLASLDTRLANKGVEGVVRNLSYLRCTIAHYEAREFYVVRRPKSYRRQRSHRTYSVLW